MEKYRKRSIAFLRVRRVKDVTDVSLEVTENSVKHTAETCE